VGPLDALLELIDAEAPGGGMGGQAVGDRGALPVTHAEIGVGGGHGVKLRYLIVRCQLLRYAPVMDMPIGLRLARTARTVAQAFERAMAEAGGSAATWQVLLLVRTQNLSHRPTQSAMARTMGITAATLTHHLNALERQGLVRRWREPDDRRSQRVELTEQGSELFDRLRGVAVAHDARLRSGLSDAEAEQLAGLLDRLAAGLE
jgi:MarR family transcriptional regulator for hemolysin